MDHYVERLLGVGSPEAVQEAARIAPTDGRALAGLAAHLLTEDPLKNPRARRDADWLSRRALAVLPGHGPALQVQASLSAQRPLDRGRP